MGGMSEGLEEGRAAVYLATMQTDLGVLYPMGPKAVAPQ